MRFDVNGVIAMAARFGDARPPGSSAALAAGDHVADGFRDAGLSVERVAAQPSWLPKTVVGSLLLAIAIPWPALPLLLWYLIAVDVLVPDYPGWVRLGLPFLMIIALGDALWFRVRQAIGEPARASSFHVMAHDGQEIERPARLVIVSALTTPSRRWVPFLNLLLFCVGVSPIFKYLLIPDARQFKSVAVLIFDLVVPWLALLLLAHGVPVPVRRPWNGDNRTGLSMLVELARAWPKPLRERVSLWLVATPDAADLPRVMPRAPSGIATLALSLDAPGVGGTIIVSGRNDAASFVADVAQSLWLPRQKRASSRHDPVARRWRMPGVDLVSLGGSRGDDPIEPAILSAVAQLIAETALRWGKDAPAQPDSQRGASAERSSQNPG